LAAKNLDKYTSIYDMDRNSDKEFKYPKFLQNLMKL